MWNILDITRGYITLLMIFLNVKSNIDNPTIKTKHHWVTTHLVPGTMLSPGFIKLNGPLSESTCKNSNWGVRNIWRIIKEYGSTVMKMCAREMGEQRGATRQSGEWSGAVQSEWISFSWERGQHEPIQKQECVWCCLRVRVKAEMVTDVPGSVGRG